MIEIKEIKGEIKGFLEAVLFIVLLIALPIVFVGMSLLLLRILLSLL